MNDTNARASSHRSASITQALTKLVHEIPRSEEAPSSRPAERAREIGRNAALRAAGLSGALALPPGPLGFATILPDLVLMWKIQRSMVSDIGSVYGMQASLTRESLFYCLFKHGAAAIARDLVVRAGERVLIRKCRARAMQELLARTGVQLSERVVTRTISRFLPLLGSFGVGAYAYYDTSRVAANAIELFSQDPTVGSSASDPEQDAAKRRN